MKNSVFLDSFANSLNAVFGAFLGAFLGLRFSQTSEVNWAGSITLLGTLVCIFCCIAILNVLIRADLRLGDSRLTMAMLIFLPLAMFSGVLADQLFEDASKVISTSLFAWLFVSITANFSREMFRPLAQDEEEIDHE